LNHPYVRPLETPRDRAVPLSTTALNSASGSLSLQHEMTVTTTTVVRSTFKQFSQAPEVINIHGHTTTAVDVANFSDPQQHEYHLEKSPQQRHTLQHFQQHQGDNYESEEITDPYDPYFPNDLLQYWERQAAAEERARLEEETKEAMEQQRFLREELTREREHHHHQSRCGASDIVGGSGKLVGNHAVMSGMGRGRGRGGVSNLPAWLVEKQRQEEQDMPSGGEGCD
jgi:hypothetical protein